MVNINKLKGKIIERGMSVTDLAKEIDIDKGTLYRRLSGNGDSFLIKEVNMICDKLELTKEEALSIFFDKNVAYCATTSETDQRVG